MTLFAPTNAAFNDIDPDEAQLRYHAIEARIASSDIINEHQENSMDGPQIRFNIYNNDEPVSTETIHFQSARIRQ